MISDLPYDILISYRHAQTAKEAKMLKAYLDELLVASWFDVLNLPQDVPIPDAELKYSLETAVRSSRLIVQFRYHQSYKQLYSWPFYERQFAKEMLIVTMTVSPPILLSPCGDMHPYYDLAHLAYLLALTVNRTDRAEAFWQHHLSPVESHLAERAPSFGVFAWHKYRRKDDWPDLINPDKPEARRNVLPGRETPEMHPETTSGHQLLSLDGRHCPYCGRSFSVLACAILWLASDGVRCYTCHQRVAYERKPMDKVTPIVLLSILSVCLWGFLVWMKMNPPWLRAGTVVFVSVITTIYIWAFVIRKWRHLVRWDC